uniref:Uncharacterized protein n=1 Tax=viral metagenome TaxID=1070528 RepID=A0A6C0HZW1_9ZZZZ
MYSNNKEYRQSLRDFFQMKCQPVVSNEDIDEETIDEFTYDADAVEKKMNEIFEKTKIINGFCKLYEIAASHMISTDLETGLAVLLSYDYFYYFKDLFSYFEKNNNKNLELSNEYKELLKKIS